MPAQRGFSAFAIDLARLHRRTVTSFYSSLVTRPTGRAVRMGVESQLAEAQPAPSICLSVLDFSQVRVLDYSCADEIVAKLLLRYRAADRPADAYFVASGLQEDHCEAVEAVLERHDLLLVARFGEAELRLLGPANPFERACWDALLEMGRPSAAEVAERTALGEDAVAATLAALCEKRVALPLSGERFSALSELLGS